MLRQGTNMERNIGVRMNKTKYTSSSNLNITYTVYGTSSTLSSIINESLSKHGLLNSECLNQLDDTVGISVFGRETWIEIKENMTINNHNMLYGELTSYLCETNELTETLNYNCFMGTQENDQFNGYDLSD